MQIAFCPDCIIRYVNSLHWWGATKGLFVFFAPPNAILQWQGSACIKPVLYCQSGRLKHFVFLLVHVSFMSFSLALPSSIFLPFWDPCAFSLFLYLPSLFQRFFVITPCFIFFVHLPLPLSHTSLFLIPPALVVCLTLPPFHHLLTLVLSCQTWQWILSHWPNQNSVLGGISSKQLLAIGKQLLWSRNLGRVNRQ